MPIKVIKREPVSPSEPAGSYVMVALGLAGEVQAMSQPKHMAAGEGPPHEVARGTEDEGTTAADVHLLWSTGELDVSGLPAGVRVVDHTPAGITRLTFRNVALQPLARADQPEWTSPRFGITASGLGQPTLVAVTTRPGTSLADAVHADVLRLDGSEAPPPNWQRLIDTLPG